MSKLASVIQVPEKYDRAAFVRILRSIEQQVNQLSEGRLYANYNAVDTPPTTGDFSAGDFIKNTDISELGSPGSAYVLIGWIYDGTNFLECRCLTGN